MFLGSSLALGPVGSSPESRVIKDLFNRAGVAIAGRDGTLVQTGGTGAGALHPTTGAVASSGDLISHNLTLAGAGVLPMSFAQGARTNLCIRSQEFDNASWVKSAVGGGTSPALISSAELAPDGSATAESYAFVSPVSGDQSVMTSAAFAVTAASIYTGSLWLKAATSADIGKVILIRHVAASAFVPHTLTSAWSRFSSQETAFGASRNFEINLRPALGSSSGIVNVAMWGAQVELGTFPGLYIPTTTTALTRAADNILWTPPSALSTTSGEVVAVAAPYLWSAGAGAAHPSGANARLFRNANHFLYRSTNDITAKVDAGTQTASVAALADASGVIRQMSSKWDASALALYRGATVAASDATPSSPWVAVTDMSVGSVTTTEHWFGFVGLIYVPGGLTDAERTALARLTAGSLNYVG